MNRLTIVFTDKELEILEEIKPSSQSNEEFIREIVQNKLSVVFLRNGFSYDMKRKELFNCDNEKVRLTRKETDFLHYLVKETKDKFVSLDDIIKNVWQNEDTSIYSVRNKVLSIRLKTEDDLIKSKSSHGYKVNFK